ncbi:acid protease [Suillus decipiens]|nr:acid protease [Suillus decipiens]
MYNEPLIFSIMGLPIKAANSPITIPITSWLKFSNGTNNLVAHNGARIQALRDRRKHRKCVPLINDHTIYIIPVDIGNPPRTYNLTLDSGSANTWVGCSNQYQSTSTSSCTDRPIAVTYRNGYFSGIEYIDTITVSPGLTVVQQSIAVADDWAEAYEAYDGILGIGPVALTLGALTKTLAEPIPTITNNLHNQKTIPKDILGIFFKPYGGLMLETTGQLTFGRTDSALHNDEIVYTDITQEEPASDFWGINQSIMYGTTEILETAPGFVSCGATYVYIATEAYELYKAAIGGEYDDETELLVISKDQYSALQELKLIIGPQTYILTPDAQIWPHSLNTLIGGEVNAIYLIVHDLGMDIGEGDSDFINGYVFMQHFYTVFDATNSHISFATTSFTEATTNY